MQPTALLAIMVMTMVVGTLLALLLAAIGVALLLPAVSDLASLVRSMGSGPRRQPAAASETPRLLFLVPAHDEELLIASCLDSLFSLDYPRDRRSVVVIADNCSDRTAAIARGRGATVLERRDPERPGKPQALAWALRQVPLQPFDGVIIVDADTILDPQFGRALARAAPLSAKAVQGFNGVRNPTESNLTRMAATLALATYRFAYPLKQRARLNVPLRGTGGCIGTTLLRRWGWDAFTIGEDWEIYARLTERGISIQYAPDARLYAQEARFLRQSRSQRQRWAAGKMTVFLRRWRSILRSPSIGARQKLDLLAELLAPGPVVHLGTVMVACGLVASFQPPGSIILLLLLASSLVRPVTYTVLALVSDPQPLAALRAFAFLPVYAAWRLATEIAALRMVGDRPWVRTARHPDVEQVPRSRRP